MNANVGIPNAGCVIKTQPLIPENTCLLKIDLGDGSSQLLQLSAEQVAALGLNLDVPAIIPEPKPIKPMPAEPDRIRTNGSIIDLLQSDEFVDPESMIIETAEKQPIPKAEAPTIGVVYKIISPEELNLKPSVQATRGRPKKRPAEEQEITPPSPKPPPVQTVVKNSRTRSGRITRPPKHIEKDFEKIVIKDEKFNSDVTTTEFEPLKTNNKTVTEQPLLELAPQTRKRNVHPEHRCPTCNKMYLGRRRMMRHFQKYPDHGPPETKTQKEDNETWKFLVDIALRCNIGQKALKFCQELTNLIHNARTLSKFLFRPGSSNKDEFYVDEILASALGLKPGGYVLNEKELTKDLSIYAYLDLNFFDETFSKTDKNKTESDANTISTTPNNIVRNENKNKNIRSNQNDDDVSSSLMQLLDITNEANKEGPDKTESFNLRNNVVPSDPSSNFQNLIEHHGAPSLQNQNSNSKFEATNQSNINAMLFAGEGSLVDNKNHAETKITNAEHIPTTEHFENHIMDFIDLRNGDALSKPSILQMETDDLHGNLNGSLNISAGHHSNFDHGKLGDGKNINDITNHLHIGHNSTVSVENKFTSVSQEKRDLEGLDKHISLPNNLLTEVDELILSSVGNSHVSNMLDTSTNSDDIMNVDQFVNERFKNITEPEIEIPNTASLSLDSLDLFNFHGT